MPTAAGLVCRHNNKAYGAVGAASYNYPDATYNTPVTAGTGPNSCTSSPRYASVPRHYYKTGVQWCDKQIATAGDKWLGYGTPVGGTCQDATDTTHIFPRFYQFGQDPTTDNYATPAFQRMDLDITQRATATYTHTWTDNSGDVADHHAHVRRRDAGSVRDDELRQLVRVLSHADPGGQDGDVVGVHRIELQLSRRFPQPVQPGVVHQHRRLRRGAENGVVRTVVRHTDPARTADAVARPR